MLDLPTVGPKSARPACRSAAAAIDLHLQHAPDLSSTRAGRRGADRSDRQTDGRTVDHFMMLTTCYADCEGYHTLTR